MTVGSERSLVDPSGDTEVGSEHQFCHPRLGVIKRQRNRHNEPYQSCNEFTKVTRDSGSLAALMNLSQNQNVIFVVSRLQKLM